MERNLLIGNGLNIQFGGKDKYSGYATMSRVVNSIKAGKYTALTENSLSPNEQLELLDGLVKVINQIRGKKLRANADGLFMEMDMDRISRTYPESSDVLSVFLEDYFLAFETINNGFRTEDGEEQSEKYRKIGFDFLRQMIVDGIYNNGEINDVYKKFYPGMDKYLNRFNNIFTTNYDYNLESILGRSERICHLHGEFSKLAPEYSNISLYYQQHKAECDKLISKMIPGIEHCYSDAVMSWSWLDKYGELIEPETKYKESLFKSISGQLEVVGLAPANDEHLFILINTNPKIKSVVYYYLNDEDRMELPHHLKKPVTYKKVKKLWDSMK